jgi:hypothetical protein
VSSEHPRFVFEVCTRCFGALGDGSPKHWPTCECVSESSVEVQLSDLIGPERSEGPLLSTLQTTALPAEGPAAENTLRTLPANRDFPSVPRPASNVDAAGGTGRTAKVRVASDGTAVAAGSPAARMRGPQQGDDGRALRV